MLIDRIFKIFTSLKLTVICLGFGIVLVFVGTLAQVHMGIHAVQEEYFGAFLVYWKPAGANWKIPVLPGGYLLGIILLLNLLAAHIFRFQWAWKKSGIFLTHLGVLLLIVGGFLSGLLSVESQMPLDMGQTKNYSEDPLAVELVLVDTSHPDYDEVVAIPQHFLGSEKNIQHPRLPFRLNIEKYYPNSKLAMRQPGTDAAAAATQDIGINVQATEIPRATQVNQQDIVSALVEIVTPEKSLGTWLVSSGLGKDQIFSTEGKTWHIGIRQARYYKPYSIQLLNFSHDLYPGTDIPKNFSSRVRVVNPSFKEDREVLIYMNHPLRYAGETYYQASFANNDKTSILQVMRNPGWLTPYFACSLVGLGLLVQFSIHLTSFIRRRKA